MNTFKPMTLLAAWLLTALPFAGTSVRAADESQDKIRFKFAETGGPQGKPGGGPEDTGETMYCKFGPKLKVLQREVLSEARGGDGCQGSAKIQGVRWSCDDVNNNDNFVNDFRKLLMTSAQESCEELCRSRGRGCKGRLISESHCGLQTSREESEQMGKHMGCKSSCPGKAFIYCSIYDAAYRTDDPARIARKEPNCRCSR